MKSAGAINRFLILLGMTALTLNVYAQESLVDLAYPSSAYIIDMPADMLVANDMPSGSLAKQAQLPPQKTVIKDPWISKAKVHQYLGVSTLVSAFLTALTHPQNGCEHYCSADYTPPTNGPHANLGRTTRALAIATVASGLIAHWDDFALEDGWSDPDNLHVLWAATGALLLVNAVGKAPNHDHGAQAELGALAMAIGVRYNW